MPEPQTNCWRPSHSGIHHTLHSYAEAGTIFDPLWSRQGKPLVVDVNGTIAFLFVMLAALHSEQRAPAIWNLCSNCGIWLWWNAQALSDRSIRNLPCLEGWEVYTVFLFTHSFLMPSVYKSFCNFAKGKRNWTQCQNSKRVPGEELYRWSHCWRQWGHQAGYQSPARGRISYNFLRSGLEYYDLDDWEPIQLSYNISVKPFKHKRIRCLLFYYFF